MWSKEVSDVILEYYSLHYASNERAFYRVDYSNCIIGGIRGLLLVLGDTPNPTHPYELHAKDLVDESRKIADDFYIRTCNPLVRVQTTIPLREIKIDIASRVAATLFSESTTLMSAETITVDEKEVTIPTTYSLIWQRIKNDDNITVVSHQYRVVSRHLYIISYLHKINNPFMQSDKEENRGIIQKLLTGLDTKHIAGKEYTDVETEFDKALDIYGKLLMKLLKGRVFIGYRNNNIYMITDNDAEVEIRELLAIINSYNGGDIDVCCNRDDSENDSDKSVAGNSEASEADSEEGEQEDQEEQIDDTVEGGRPFQKNKDHKWRNNRNDRQNHQHGKHNKQHNHQHNHQHKQHDQHNQHHNKHNGEHRDRDNITNFKTIKASNIFDIRLPGELFMKKIVLTMINFKIVVFNTASYEVVPVNLIHSHIVQDGIDTVKCALDSARCRYFLIEDNTSNNLVYNNIMKFAILITTKQDIEMALAEEYPTASSKEAAAELFRDRFYGIYRNMVTVRKLFIKEFDRIGPYFPYVSKTRKGEKCTGVDAKPYHFDISLVDMTPHPLVNNDMLDDDVE
jgi:hypothetical protein